MGDCNRLIWDGKLDDNDEKLLRITPFSEIQINDQAPMQIMRCVADGGIVLDTQSSLMRHAGHRMRQPVILTKQELMDIVEGVIE
jgi:hypothetical protein